MTRKLVTLREVTFMSRVVVTGLGLITSLGNDLATNWEALIRGKSGVSEITAYDTSAHRVHIGAEVKNFDPSPYMDRKEVRRNDPYEQMAIATTRQALDQAGLRITEENADDIGVYIGSGLGGLRTMHEQLRILYQSGPDRISPFFINMMIVDGAPGIVSILTGARGPTGQPFQLAQPALTPSAKPGRPSGAAMLKP